MRKPLIFQTLPIRSSRIHSLKYQSYKTYVCKDEWNRKYDFDYFLFRAWREKESAKGEKIDERQDKSINQL